MSERNPTHDPVLLVIDMQNTYVHPEGGLARNGVDTSPLAAVVPAVVRLIRACQARRIPGIYTRQNYYPDDRGMAAKRVWPKTRRVEDGGAHGGVHASPYALEGTWDADVVDEIKRLIRPLPDDRILDKPRYSAFYQTGLDNHLRILGARTLILCGVTTNVCVDSTVRDAFFRNYDLLVVREGVATAQPELQDPFLDNFDLFFGRVVSLDELMDHWLPDDQREGTREAEKDR